MFFVFTFFLFAMIHWLLVLLFAMIHWLFVCAMGCVIFELIKKVRNIMLASQAYMKDRSVLQIHNSSWGQSQLNVEVVCSFLSFDYSRISVYERFWKWTKSRVTFIEEKMEKNLVKSKRWKKNQNLTSNWFQPQCVVVKLATKKKNKVLSFVKYIIKIQI